MTDTNNAVPRHLGIILDGNRRWAKEQGLKTLEGHQKGAEVFREIVYAALDRGVEFISAYVFSTENWQRTQEEVSYLMGLVLKVVDKYLDEFHQKGVKILILGSKEGLDSKTIKALDQTVAKTAGNTNGTVALCFNYGGHQEIIDGIKSLPEAEKADLTPVKFEQYLYSKEVPEVDLVLRTSGEQRTSGFMLWRAAYAELMFVDKFWPDFSVQDLDEVLAEYKSRNRRFGK
jgi:undecaprenyl diphosphate synthase